MGDKGFHEPADLARQLKVSHGTVLKWAREGLISAIRFGRLWRITDEEYQRILQEGTERKRDEDSK